MRNLVDRPLHTALNSSHTVCFEMKKQKARGVGDVVAHSPCVDTVQEGHAHLNSDQLSHGDKVLPTESITKENLSFSRNMGWGVDLGCLWFYLIFISSTTKINTWRETWRKGGEEREGKGTKLSF